MIYDQRRNENEDVISGDDTMIHISNNHASLIAIILPLYSKYATYSFHITPSSPSPSPSSSSLSSSEIFIPLAFSIRGESNQQTDERDLSPIDLHFIPFSSPTFTSLHSDDGDDDDDLPSSSFPLYFHSSSSQPAILFIISHPDSSFSVILYFSLSSSSLLLFKSSFTDINHNILILIIINDDDDDDNRWR
jgi:hypothetical protein